MKTLKKNIFNDVIISVLIGITLSLPVTGFIYGFIYCERDCSILGRIFIGFVEMFLTTIQKGMPWDNEAGTSNTNLIPYAILVAVIIACFFFTLFRFISSMKMRSVSLSRNKLKDE